MNPAMRPLESVVQVLPGTQARELPGGPPGRATRGVVLCHGFTGSAQSLGDWPDHLANSGYRVRVPRLPGHGTSWKGANRTGWPDWFRAVERALLRSSSASPVVVGGLSMGGALALALAIAHPERVAGLVLVNPAVRIDRPILRATGLLRHLVPGVAGVGGDIADPAAVTEIAYPKVPVSALHSQRALWRGVLERAHEVTAPLLLMRSRVDHVVPASSSAAILQRVSSADVTELILERSFHVATLDYDADLIASESLAFCDRVLSPAAQP